MYVIAKDGSGDFTALQDAIDAIPSSNAAPVTLRVRAGEYREKIVLNKDHVRVVGESRDATIVAYSGCAKDLDAQGREKGTFLSYTFLVTGNDVDIENITIRNDAGDGRTVGQAVAVYAAGDRGAWRNVRMIGCQDTLLCGPTMPKVAADALPRRVPEGVSAVGDCPPVSNRQYFERCLIRGDVDFIFGPYRCWFERCTLYMNERGGYYTAANTPEGSPYGFVFHRCRLTGECAPGMAFLGRPWRAFAYTQFIACEMDACVAPEGFRDWGERKVTRRCGEYRTTGARADQSARHPGQARLSDAEAAEITLRRVLGGDDGWNPAANARAPVDIVSAAQMADSLMKRYGLLTDRWSYDYGVAWRGMEALRALTGDDRYLDYIKGAMDTFVTDDSGAIRDYDPDAMNLDYICNGRQLLFLYKETGDGKYMTAADALREQLRRQPRTEDGGFWHKRCYPNQMWLDGLHMAAPFYTEYCLMTGDDAGVRDAAKQLTLAYRHTYEPRTGLNHHAWDASRSERWADPATGRAAHAWGRAVGWYMLGLIDVIELLPPDHDCREPLKALFRELAARMLAIREEGAWLQVLDCPGREGNYLEASASCLITCALLKAARLNVAPAAVGEAAVESFHALGRHFVWRMRDGTPFLAKTCHGAGLGGPPERYRDGSYAYYISEAVGSYDIKGTGAYIQAAVEYERIGR